MKNEDLEFFDNIPYEYEGNGDEDWACFQRPTHDGEAYMCECPGEPDNSFVVRDPKTVAILKSRYEQWAMAKGLKKFKVFVKYWFGESDEIHYSRDESALAKTLAEDAYFVRCNGKIVKFQNLSF